LAKYIVKAANKKQAAARINKWTVQQRHYRETKHTDNHCSRRTKMVEIGAVPVNTRKYEKNMAAVLDAKRVRVLYAGTVGGKAGEKLKPQNRIVVFEVWGWRPLNPRKDTIKTLRGAYWDKFLADTEWPEAPNEVSAASIIVKKVRPHARAAIEAKNILNGWFFGDNEFCPTCYALLDSDGECGNCCVDCHEPFEEGNPGPLCGKCEYEADYMAAMDYCGGCGYHTGAVCNCP